MSVKNTNTDNDVLDIYISEISTEPLEEYLLHRNKEIIRNSFGFQRYLVRYQISLLIKELRKEKIVDMCLKFFNL